jgi:hypothetical protein
MYHIKQWCDVTVILLCEQNSKAYERTQQDWTSVVTLLNKDATIRVDINIKLVHYKT